MTYVQPSTKSKKGNFKWVYTCQVYFKHNLLLFLDNHNYYKCLEATYGSVSFLSQIIYRCSVLLHDARKGTRKLLKKICHDQTSYQAKEWSNELIKIKQF